MLDNYSQVCWVVRDLQKSMADWIRIGAGPFFVLSSEVLPERIYRGVTGRDHFLCARGFLRNTQIELIQPTTDEPSLFREILDSVGESIHHIQPNCGVIDAAGFDAEARRYSGSGMEMVHTMVVPGMGRIMYFDGRQQFGYFFEVAERPAHMYRNSMEMYQAHISWDGSQPIRQSNFIAASRTTLN